MASGRQVRSTSAIESGTGAAVPLGAILAHHAKRDPKRPALVFPDGVLRRDELDARSNRRAHHLASLGVQEGHFVTVAMANGSEFYETCFAIWKLGAIPNIVSARLPQAELAAIVQLVNPQLVIGEPGHAMDGRPRWSAGCPLPDSLSTEPLPLVVSPHWKAMTSGGSTGRPKVIVDAAPGLWNPSAHLWGQKPDDVILNPGPLYHNAPFLSTHAGLFIGATVVDMLRFDAERALALIESQAVNWINLVPTMMARISRLGSLRARYNLGSLEVAIHMGAPCPNWLKRDWIEWLGPDRLFESYGTTERLGGTIIGGREWLERPGSVGKVQPGSAIRILRDDGTEADEDEVGEIHFMPKGGAGSTYRYLGSEPRRRIDGWETVGDLGRIDGSGYLFLADRRTDLIISGGANIYPAEIEAAIDNHPDVLSCAVVGLPDADWGQRVHAIVELAPGARLAPDAIIGHAARSLARYKLPKTVEFTTQSLRDEAGKVRRSALREGR